MKHEMRAVRLLHRWCGLAAGLLLVAVALTGAGMVFRAQLEPLQYAGLQSLPACASPLPPSRLVAAARAALPGAGALSAIRMAGAAAPVRIRFGDWRWVYVDPCSARVMGIRDAYSGVFGTLAWLHSFAYAPGGNVVAGCVALAAMTLAVAGLVLWAKTRPAATRPARARHGAAARLNPAARGLCRHRQLALWCAPVLLVLALSGVPQAFPIAATAVPAPGPSGPPAGSGAATTVTGAAPALDLIWSQVVTGDPGWRQLQLRFSGAGAPVKLETAERGAPHDYAVSTGYYDPVTGAALRYAPYATATVARKAYLWGLALHYGAVGGPAWQLAQFSTALMVPFLAWTGVASYLRRRSAMKPEARQPLLLRAKRGIARDICAFEFVHPRGRKLPAWTAGAHIDIHIAPGLVRQYSLCGDPRDRSRYLIAVHRCSPSRGGSHAMHGALHEGMRVTLGMPRNHFALQDSPHTVLLAGGIGITPLLAMAETLAGSGASFELHYCVRSPDDTAFAERLHEGRFRGRVLFHYSSGGRRADMDGILSAPPRGARLYICGAAGFTDAALAAAARQGWPAANVHTERFSAPASGAAQAAFDVVIASTGRVIHVPAGQAALDAMLDAGVDIPASCRQGICGTCATPVLEGEADHRDHCLSAEARAVCFTPCCSRARSAQLVLDL